MERGCLSGTGHFFLFQHNLYVEWQKTDVCTCKLKEHLGVSKSCKCKDQKRSQVHQNNILASQTVADWKSDLIRTKSFSFSQGGLQVNLLC